MKTCYALCYARITHVITIMPASKLHFLANKNAKLAGRSQYASQGAISGIAEWSHYWLIRYTVGIYILIIIQNLYTR